MDGQLRAIHFHLMDCIRKDLAEWNTLSGRSPQGNMCTRDIEDYKQYERCFWGLIKNRQKDSAGVPGGMKIN